MSASAITSLGVSASLAPASTKSRTLGEEGEWEELKEEREEEEGEELEEEREEGTDLLDGPVPHGHGVARVEEVLHDARAHDAQAQEPEVQLGRREWRRTKRRRRRRRSTLLGWMSFSLSIWLLVTRSIPTAGDTGLQIEIFIFIEIIKFIKILKNVL